jgi:uncharacterized protein YdhG (YjbR/CyaY superfamily)
MTQRGQTGGAVDKGTPAVVATVTAYLAAQPPASRRVLRPVRKAVRAALPLAQESITYGIPTYKMHGKAAVLSAFGTELQDYYISKGTIRFPIDQPVPVDLVARMATVRACEVQTAPGRKLGSKKR